LGGTRHLLFREGKGEKEKDVNPGAFENTAISPTGIPKKGGAGNVAFSAGGKGGGDRSTSPPAGIDQHRIKCKGRERNPPPLKMVPSGRERREEGSGGKDGASLTYHGLESRT